MSIEEKNRKIAELLGWTRKPFKGARTVFADDDEWCAYPITEKYETEVWHVPECTCPPNIITDQDCVSAKLPDFHTSESANAMVLEAMPWPNVSKWRINSGYIWHCSPSPSYTGMDHVDRLHAICDAFLAMHGVQP